MISIININIKYKTTIVVSKYKSNIYINYISNNESNINKGNI